MCHKIKKKFCKIQKSAFTVVGIPSQKNPQETIFHYPYIWQFKSTRKLPQLSSKQASFMWGRSQLAESSRSLLSVLTCFIFISCSAIPIFTFASLCSVFSCQTHSVGWRHTRQLLIRVKPLQFTAPIIFVSDISTLLLIPNQLDSLPLAKSHLFLRHCF